MRQIGVLAAPARVAVESVFLSGEHVPRSNAIAKRLEESWIRLGGRVQPGLEQETNMVWLDLKAAKVTDAEFVAIAEQEGVKVFDGRIVTHYRKHTFLNPLFPSVIFSPHKFRDLRSSPHLGLRSHQKALTSLEQFIISISYCRMLILSRDPAAVD